MWLVRLNIIDRWFAKSPPKFCLSLQKSSVGILPNKYIINYYFLIYKMFWRAKLICGMTKICSCVYIEKNTLQLVSSVSLCRLCATWRLFNHVPLLFPPTKWMYRVNYSYENPLRFCQQVCNYRWRRHIGGEEMWRCHGVFRDFQFEMEFCWLFCTRASEVKKMWRAMWDFVYVPPRLIFHVALRFTTTTPFEVGC